MSKRVKRTHMQDDHAKTWGDALCGAGNKEEQTDQEGDVTCERCLRAMLAKARERIRTLERGMDALLDMCADKKGKGVAA